MCLRQTSTKKQANKRVSGCYKLQQNQSSLVPKCPRDPFKWRIQSMATNWQNKTVIADVFFVLLSVKRLSFHSRSHYPSTNEVLRWQPVDWQLIGSRLREPTIADEWSRRPALSSFSSLSHFTRQPQDVGCVDACHRSSAGSFLLYFDQRQNLFCIFQPCLGSKWFDCQLCVVFVLGWVFSFRVIFTNISRNG